MILEFNTEDPAGQEWTGPMEKAAEAVMEMHGIDGEELFVSISFVDADEIRELNREYRSTDKVTDVLSFPQFEDVESLRQACDGPGPVMAGDVVICTEKAEAQAEGFGHSKERELVYLFTHSLLHLMGYDHMEKEEKDRMRTAEEDIMERIGLPR